MVPRPQVPWKYILGLAFFWGGLQFVLTNIGFSLGVSAGLASLISQASLFFSVIYSVLLFGEKTISRHWVGMIIGFFGVAVATCQDAITGEALGILCLLAAAATWGAGNVLLKRSNAKNMLSLTVWFGAIAAGPLLFLSLLIEGPVRIWESCQHAQGLAWMAAIYSGLGSVVLGGTLWGFLLRKHTINEVTPYTLLVPAFSIVMGSLLLGESVTVYEIVGGLIVFSGLFITQQPIGWVTKTK